jgi:hypothetical protein
MLAAFEEIRADKTNYAVVLTSDDPRISVRA